MLGCSLLNSSAKGCKPSLIHEANLTVTGLVGSATSGLRLARSTCSPIGWASAPVAVASVAAGAAVASAPAVAAGAAVGSGAVVGADVASAGAGALVGCDWAPEGVG